MIVFFPEIYPDELMYSVMVRHYEQSGYAAYTYCAETMFKKVTIKPEIEFINDLTPEVYELVTKHESFDSIIQNHTMFPCYGRFLAKERRDKAYQSLMQMQGNYSNLLEKPTKKNNKERFLRYCPLCVREDREKLGETYWHRKDQLLGVNVCPIHFCKLIDTDVKIDKKKPSSVSAEESIPLSDDIVISENEIERKVAQYITDVFESPVDLENDIAIGTFLHSKMSGTKYLSTRGEGRKMSILHSDFSEYYKDLPENWFTERWQIDKVLSSYRINNYEICLLALFLNVPVNELVKMKLPEVSQQQLFDEEIFRLHEQGLKYPEIARRLNASYNVVKVIGEKRYKKPSKKSDNPAKSGAKPNDWNQIDIDTLPLVKTAIKEIWGDGIARPKRVNIHAVEKHLKLPNKRLTDYLPICRAEIEKYAETQEEYWAREVAWAVNHIVRNGDVLNWRHVRDLTNMRKRDLIACMPYIVASGDADMIAKVQGILASIA